MNRRLRTLLSPSRLLVAALIVAALPAAGYTHVICTRPADESGSGSTRRPGRR